MAATSPSGRITPLTPANADAAVSAILPAFVDLDTFQYFFGGSVAQRQAPARRFLSLLLAARLDLGMPAIALECGSEMAGLAMGYD